MNNEIKEILEIQEDVDYKRLSIEDIMLLKDYITNLQEENNILRQNAEHNDKVVDKARWNEMLYKGRNERAIEYVKNHSIIFDDVSIFDRAEPNELLQILGISKEEKKIPDKIEFIDDTKGLRIFRTISPDEIASKVNEIIDYLNKEKL